MCMCLCTQVKDANGSCQWLTNTTYSWTTQLDSSQGPLFHALLSVSNLLKGKMPQNEPKKKHQWTGEWKNTVCGGSRLDYLIKSQTPQVPQIPHVHFISLLKWTFEQEHDHDQENLKKKECKPIVSLSHVLLWKMNYCYLLSRLRRLQIWVGPSPPWSRRRPSL